MIIHVTESVGDNVVRWSPTFSATGLTFTGSGTTYPTYGSYYLRIGKLVSFYIKLDFTTVTNFGTGQFTLELPFMPHGQMANHFLGWAWADPSQPPDQLNGHVQIIGDHLPGSKTLDMHWMGGDTPAPKPVVEHILYQGFPITFTTASKMYIGGTYICQ